MTADRDDELAALSASELSSLARDCIQELGRRGTRESFSQLLDLTPVVGQALGESARTLGESSSWTQVGQLAGTSKQAAWARWRS